MDRQARDSIKMLKQGRVCSVLRYTFILSHQCKQYYAHMSTETETHALAHSVKLKQASSGWRMCIDFMIYFWQLCSG